MSYAPVSAQRSTAYALAGLGCPCSPAPMAGLGIDFSSLAAGLGVSGAGFVGLIAGYFLGKHSQRVGLALNRGKRRRNRRRR